MIIIYCCYNDRDIKTLQSLFDNDDKYFKDFNSIRSKGHKGFYGKTKSGPNRSYQIH